MLVVLCACLLSSFTTGMVASLRTRRDGAAFRYKTTLTQNAPQDAYVFDLTTSLNPTASTITTLSIVPANCAIYNTPGPESECPTYFVASSVTYADCADSFTICQCETANISLSTAVERLGRVPVGLRRYIATVALLNGNETRANTLTTGDIHMLGDPQVDTWVHEAGHAYDSASGVPFSGSKEWLEAIGKDTCVLDTYSATSARENFAQQIVMKIYTMTHNNTLPAGISPGCMSHQLAYIDRLSLFQKETLFGSTCAIEGSEPGARHTTAPLVLPDVLPPPPVPTSGLPTAVPESAIGTPTTIPGPSPSASRRDNAAIDLLVHHSKFVVFSGILLATWLSCPAHTPRGSWSIHMSHTAFLYSPFRTKEPFTRYYGMAMAVIHVLTICTNTRAAR